MMTADFSIEIGGHPVGAGHPTYIIAEMSANHAQDLDRAHAIVEAAAESGADALKLQTYTPETMTIDSKKEFFLIEGDTLWEGKRLFELYQEAYLPWEWHADIKGHAEELGMACFSTPFDPTAVEFLEKIDVPAYKVASFEIVDLPLIATIAEQGRPMIMSTGMAELGEIDDAVRTVRENGGPPLALMRCNSAYPARPAEMDLRTIPHMVETWEVPVGLSDHTLGSTSAVTAVALGASLVEKHLTLDRSDGGPDSEFSMEPHEFERMVEEIRVAEKALGKVRYGPTDREEGSLMFRRSIFAVRDIAEGEEFTEENLRSIRPGYGLEPKHLERMLGRRASTHIRRGEPIVWSMIDKGEQTELTK